MPPDDLIGHVGRPLLTALSCRRLDLGPLLLSNSRAPFVRHLPRLTPGPRDATFPQQSVHPALRRAQRQGHHLRRLAGRIALQHPPPPRPASPRAPSGRALGAPPIRRVSTLLRSTPRVRSSRYTRSRGQPSSPEHPDPVRRSGCDPTLGSAEARSSSHTQPSARLNQPGTRRHDQRSDHGRREA